MTNINKRISPILFLCVVAAQAAADDLLLDYSKAVDLAQLPFTCIKQEYPADVYPVLSSTCDIQTPCEKHPVFCGCYDWHSSVHGHWSLAKMMNKFPNTSLAEKVADLFDDQFKPEKVAQESYIFTTPYNADFEMAYGWAWLLKLQMELRRSPLDAEKGWSANLAPLVSVVVDGYRKLLRTLVYPVRTGEHYSTAFAFSLAIEYAEAFDQSFANDIQFWSNILYLQNGKNDSCPLNWEPSGYDFLSPCLQEADFIGQTMSSENDFKTWLQDFLPEALGDNFVLEPGTVLDPTEGKLVHLYGLNFARAWNIYSIVSNLKTVLPAKNRNRLLSIADTHIRASRDYVVDSHYAGSHWLASFLFYALEMKEKAYNSI